MNLLSDERLESYLLLGKLTIKAEGWGEAGCLSLPQTELSKNNIENIFSGGFANNIT